jgi:O-antigen ligase
MPAIATKCVIVLLLLLPLKFLGLPANMTLADAWAAVVLPVCWVAFSRQPLPLRLPYLPAVLLILAATVLASLLSADPAAGVAVALKDLYLYAWLVTLAAVFERVDAGGRRALLTAWCAGATVNAVLIVAQFVHPPLLALVAEVLTGTGQEAYRPAGLMVNSNAAAGFQVLGLVPLVMLGPRPRVLVPLVALSAAAVLCTGSLGAAVALASGLAVGLIVVLLYSADRRTVAGLALRSVLAALLCLVAVELVMRGGAELGERFQSISWARADRSASGRFELWDRGVDRLMSDLPLLGIGPDRFRQLEGSEMHNDFLGFAVERGLLGLLGLCLFAAMAVVRSIELFRLERARGRLRAAVFPAALAAAMAASLTHEVFHSREVWLVLAVQEAFLGRARRAQPA